MAKLGTDTIDTRPPESAIRTFVSDDYRHAVYLFDGQELLAEMASLDQFHGKNQEFFRILFLSCGVLSSFLKAGESYAVYFDSEQSDVFFKFETDFSGGMRCMLSKSPTNVGEFVSGVLRVIKLSPGERTPYKSIIKIEHLAWEELINEALRVSFQFDAVIRVSNSADIAHAIFKLPTGKNEDPEEIAEAGRKKEIHELFSENIQTFFADPESLNHSISEKGFHLLTSKKARLHCACSKERVLHALIAVPESEMREEFMDGKDIQTRCEFCGKSYTVSESEYNEFLTNIN